MSSSCTRRPSRAAFTLMEVLLVLVILVVLGSLAVGMFSGAKRRADKNAAQVQVDAIGDASERYNLDMGTFPAQLDDLINDPGNPNWGGPYLNKAVPIDPWGNPYGYEQKGQHHNGLKPDVWSLGPNGVNDAESIYNR